MTLVKSRIPALFNEDSISYSYDKESQEEYGFQLFEYRWQYKPTSSNGTHSIFTFSKTALDRLLAHWNTKSEAWHYSPI